MLKYQNNIKKTWNVIKDAKGKTKNTPSSFPKKIMYKMKTITDVHLFAKHFKPYFTEIGPNLANKIGKAMNFEGHTKKCSSIQPEHPLSINKLKNAFFLLDINKSPGVDGIGLMTLRNCFGAFHKPLFHVFNLPIIKSIFPDDLKIACVTPVFVKRGDEKALGSYRPVSV